MRYRPLGTTGLTVSEIGFGAWGIGGDTGGAVAYGPTDDQESLRALKRAFELGVTFYDTADLYGHGHSEQLLGEAFRDVRARVILASKTGFLDQAGRQDFSPAHVRTSLEGSLRRLGTDYLDLYQLHDPPMALLEQEPRIVETLEAFVQQGMIRAWGLSLRSPDDALVAIRRLGAACIQTNFNLLDQRAIESGLLALCEAQRAGVIIRTPLCFGFLTGAIDGATPFDGRDHRSRWSAEQRVRWAAGARTVAQTLSTPQSSPAQLALRFCLSYPAVSTAIPGMLTAAHVDENAAASDLEPLAERERCAAEAVYHKHVFFGGRA